ncbi:MAG: hypothetical protein ACREMB_18395 [Candidatus Rokuibacteriota bacterium]
MAVRPRWLLIIRRDRSDLVQSLGERYPDAAVLVDRRQADRRQRPEPVPIERRSSQRRAPLVLSEQQMWDALGYRLVYRPGGGRSA